MNVNRRRHRPGGRGGRPGGKPPKPPMLLGEPSPGLARIKAMNIVTLEKRIETLKQEAVNVTAKLERLKAHKPPPPQERIDQLDQHVKRLAALTEYAEARLKRKLEAKAQYEAARRSGAPMRR